MDVKRKLSELERKVRRLESKLNRLQQVLEGQRKLDVNTIVNGLRSLKVQ